VTNTFRSERDGLAVEPVVAMTPFVLLNGLQIAGPMAPVIVKGKVHGAPRIHAAGAYVTLTGEGASIEARVPIHEAPNAGETVRVLGTVRVKPGYLRDGLSVLVAGRLENPPALRSRERITLQKERRVPLEAVISDEASLQKIVVVGTVTALSDIGSTGLRTRLPFVQTSTVDADALIGAATRSIESGVRGVIFARGGSNNASEDLWDDTEFVSRLLALDVPFYTAIGHSDGIHLADQYADQAFTTPTHVGNELLRILCRDDKQNAERAKATVERDRLLQELARLRADIAAAARNREAAIAAQTRPAVPMPGAPAMGVRRALLSPRAVLGLLIAAAIVGFLVSHALATHGAAPSHHR